MALVAGMVARDGSRGRPSSRVMGDRDARFESCAHNLTHPNGISRSPTGGRGDHFSLGIRVGTIDTTGASVDVTVDGTEAIDLNRDQGVDCGQGRA